MMKRLRPRSILVRILPVALLPIALLALLLSTYAVNTRIGDLEAAFDDGGQARARQLASVSVVGLFGRDRDARADGTAPERATGQERRLLRGRVVLVADDNAVNLELNERLLGSYGADTVAARDGDTALRLASERWFDLVLLDIHMPGTDGQTVATELRDQPRYATTPILALTADVRACDELDAGNGPFDDCLPKPLVDSVLRATVERLLPGPRQPALRAERER
jgi:CheY-like chemotaxis protein